MANVLVEESTLQNIANSIRSKSGKTDKMIPSQMSGEIDNLPSGGGITNGVEYLEFDSSGCLTKAKVHGEVITHRNFYEQTNLIDVELPSNLTTIGDRAFENCTNLALTELPNSVTTIGIYAFYKCTNLALTELPNSVTTILENTFDKCANLTSIKCGTNLNNIKGYAFTSCSNLNFVEFNSNLTKIERWAFRNCPLLKEVTFKCNTTSKFAIDSDAFNMCSNLTTINVSWSEGEVAYAPWGATNATINYNYVG